MCALTISEVVKIAGASVVTVFRMANNSPPVSRKTQVRVQEVIERPGYQPNVQGRSLRWSENRVVPVIVSDASNPCYIPIIAEMEGRFHEDDYSGVLCIVSAEAERRALYLEFLKDGRADGVILMELARDSPHMTGMTCHYHLVQCSEYCDNQAVSRVSVDNLAAAREVVLALARLGRWHIGFIGADSDFVSIIARRQDYLDGLRVLKTPPREDDRTFAERDYNFASDVEAARRLLARPERLTALSCIPDMLALGAVQAAQELGLRVPEDLSVAGFDDVEYAVTGHPRLITVHQPCCRLGWTVGEPLFAQIQGGPRGWAVYLPHIPVGRDSITWCVVGSQRKWILVSREEISIRLKKLAALIPAGTTSPPLATCGGGGGDTISPTSNTGPPSAATDTPALGGEVYKIDVLAPEMTHGQSVGVACYAEKRCDELAAEGKIEKKILINGDAAEIAAQLDELKTQGADAIVAFLQWEGMEVPVQQAIGEGITVVNFDIVIEADGMYHVPDNNEGTSKDAAEYITDKIGIEDTVIILDVSASDSVVELRKRGSTETMAAEAPNMVLRRYATELTHKAGLADMVNVLTVNLQTDATFSMDDKISIGALQVIRDASCTDIKVITGGDGYQGWFNMMLADENQDIRLQSNLCSPVMVEDTVDMALDILSDNVPENPVKIIPTEHMDRKSATDYLNKNPPY